MSDLITRALTGLFFISVVLGGIWWNDLASFGVFFLFLVLGMVEFTRLFNKHASIELCKTSLLTACLVLFTLLSAISIGIIQSYLYVLIFPLLFLVFLPELWRKKKNPILNLSVLVFGIIYLVLPFL